MGIFSKLLSFLYYPYVIISVKLHLSTLGIDMGRLVVYSVLVIKLDTFEKNNWRWTCMKLIIFFGLIVFSLLVSLLLGRKDLKNNKRPVTAIIKALLVNIVVLGVGSLWWFLTETDGISQGIGVMIYLGSIVGISLIDMVFIYVWNGLARTE